MKILLDTHIWLWWLAGSERITDSAKEMLNSKDNEIFLSVASAWEISIKSALGKISLPSPPSEYIASRLAAQQIKTLEIDLAHACYVGKLPPHHNDPFDRMLLAQAICENMTLISADVQLSAYNVPMILI